jgi:alpha-tubulin suppressor-like RCC1 family protein
VIVVGPCRSIACQPQPTFVDVSAGARVTCAVHSVSIISLEIGTPTASNLRCWGDNTNGMLGTGFGTTTEICTSSVGGITIQEHCSSTPLTVAGGLLFSAVSVGGTHVCAIQRSTGAAFCWGDNRSGELGINSNGALWLGTPTTPVPGFSFNSISAGDGQTCGVTTAQALVCWGKGSSTPTQLLVGTLFNSVSVEGSLGPCGLDTSAQTCKTDFHGPYAILGQGGMSRHLCEITTSGITQCFGDNNVGQLGNGNTTLTNNLVQVLMPANVSAFQFVATGENHSCALSGTDAFCWGHGYFGEIGNEMTNGANRPQMVHSPFGTTLVFSKITAGSQHTCGLAQGGSIWCWGRNESGQLGVGSSQNFIFQSSDPMVVGSALPMRVVGS